MNEVRAIVFQGHKTAAKAFHNLDEEGAISWLDEVAVLSRGKHGIIRVNSTWAQDDRALVGGIGLGVLTGALVGALMGPGGAVAGAVGAGALAGGSIAGVVGGSFDLAVSDPRLDRFAEKLKDDTSALVLVSDSARADEFVSVFGPFNGEVIETQLNEHDLAALKEALKAERQRAH